MEPEYKTNQFRIGMKYIFQGIVIKAWMGTNFGTTKYTELNRIIIKYYMNFYYEYWLDRCEKLHDKEEKRR